MTDSRTESPRAFDRLLSYVQSELDFETGFYNDAYLDRRITARMRRTGADSYRAYQRQLADDPDERAALLDSLSINVTGFFRNPEAWDRIGAVLRTVTDGPGRTRCWSVPCADGREPYSLAMLALDDPEIDDRRLEILGTDISEAALAVAREGRYETSQTTDIAAELSPLDDYSAYVDRDGDEFRVTDRVREMVTFERHDLIRGEPKAGFDVVLCRNLLIYIDAEYKMPIFETIEGSLRERGYLIIGMTETLPHECRGAFEPVDKRHRVYRRR
ncbi:chemotaxis protein CheR [Halobacteriales archaeon QS_1_68_17]|nr:MAG: chemotaxis protein CheR [Halobacteriales archaeon QS_1_68_17]